MSQQTHWRNYEEAAQYILGQMAAHFGLGRVEGKQLVAGVSGASWEIDAKGTRSAMLNVRAMSGCTMQTSTHWKTRFSAIF